MSKSPNRGIDLYNTTTDSQAKFLTFRDNIAGESASSALMILDKWSGDVDKKITALEKVNPNILINASWVSQGYYEATTTEITTYRDNLIITFRPNVDNDGTTILKINNLDVKTLMKYDSVGGVKNLDPKDLRKNHEYQFRYDGTRWVWQGGSSADQTNIVGDVDNLIMIDENNNLVDSGIDKDDIAMKSQIKNNLTETTTGNILDAAQGKILDDKIGVLTALKTTEKGNLVGAINENTEQINVLSDSPDFTGTPTIQGKRVADIEKVSPKLSGGWIAVDDGSVLTYSKVGISVTVSGIIKGGITMSGTVLCNTLPPTAKNYETKFLTQADGSVLAVNIFESGQLQIGGGGWNSIGTSTPVYVDFNYICN